MYVLSKDRLTLIINGLVEGQSIRALERITGIHRDTIMRWMVRVGDSCAAMHHRLVRNVQVRYAQADELWSFVGEKGSTFEKFDPTNGWKGEAWVFVAMDADTKLVLSYAVGHRDQDTAYHFLTDLRGRITGPFQLTTDGFPGYVGAAYQNLMAMEGVDFGQLVKIYKGDEVIAARPTVVFGNPNVDKISTSYVERQNLTLRTNSKRFTRKTIAFSKKAGHHLAALHLGFAHYNFCRVHRSLKMTPALAAGIADHLWTTDELVEPAWSTFHQESFR